MALRDQPYIPLYIQDFLTDEKLIECSAESCGVYIRLLCLMHKSNEYGTILLKQKDKQTLKQVENFACKLVKQMPYDKETIHKSLHELIDEGVIQLIEDKLLQKRMIEDNRISLLRSKAGKKGGFATQFALAKDEANSENEDVIVNENRDVNKDTIIKEEQFLSLWKQYPNKDGKKQAFKHFIASVRTDLDIKNIQKALKNYIGCKKVKEGFIKNGSTWFNNWEDWVEYEENKKESDPYASIPKL